MKIDLVPELEKVLDAAVRSGEFKSREDALAAAIHQFAHSKDTNGSSAIDDLEADVWIERFHKWSRKSRVGNPQLDDSRESIYEGRGE